MKPGIVPEDQKLRARFERAREAVQDPTDSEARFGIQSGGGFRDVVNGATTTPGFAKSGRAIILELVFPLDVGDEIDFRVNEAFSPEGTNAPALNYVETEDLGPDSMAMVEVVQLDSASGTVESLEPLSLAVEFRSADGRTGTGSLELVHDRQSICD